MLLHMCMFVKQNDKAIYFQYTLARENGTFELRTMTMTIMADTIITDEEGKEAFLVNYLTLIKAFYLEL